MRQVVAGGGYLDEALEGLAERSPARPPQGLEDLVDLEEEAVPPQGHGSSEGALDGRIAHGRCGLEDRVKRPMGMRAHRRAPRQVDGHQLRLAEVHEVQGGEPFGDGLRRNRAAGAGEPDEGPSGVLVVEGGQSQARQRVAEGKGKSGTGHAFVGEGSTVVAAERRGACQQRSAGTASYPTPLTWEGEPSMQSEPPLADRVGLVTGASAGIGAATARALAAAGMAVMVCARRAERLAALCDEIRTAGGQADWRAVDLRDPSQVDALVATTVERFGRLDALVNNAAVGTLGPVVEGEVEAWRAVLETNVLAPMVACRAALRHMLPRRQGDILNIGSAAAVEPWPHLAAYAASKAALMAFSRSLRAEVAAHGVRVMTIEIHNVQGTDFVTNLDPGRLPEALARWAEVGALNPKAPPILPEDVGRVVVFQLAQPQPASLHHVVVRSREN